MKKTAALLLTLLLSLPLSISALAADYPDLDESHWAYDALIRACELGILGGMPDGTVQPSGTLTWGQYLAMLGRAFYPDRKSTRLNSSHITRSRMPSSA